MKLRRHTPGLGIWLRGRALLDEDYIVLDKAHSTEYQPMTTTELLFDLAAIRRPSDALPFVRRYGLLFHGPDADEFREPWSEWERTALLLSGFLHMHVSLHKAVRGDAAAAEELRSRWGETVKGFYKQEAPTEEMFFLQVTDFLAHWTTQGLEGAQFGVGPAAFFQKDGEPYGGPGDFVLTVNPPNLLGYAYNQFAHFLNQGVPGARCPECGRVFVIKDRRQRFCSPQCAQRARYRRWKERQS
jgi:hypothetical protein